MYKQGKSFFSKHAKSSAFFVSVIIHAVIIITAISLVAFTFQPKEHVDFLGVKNNKKPTLKTRKLNIPTQQKNNTKKLKLQPRPVVETPTHEMPTFEVPTFATVQSDASSLSGDGTGSFNELGLDIDPVNMFTIKTYGEKFYFILDCSHFMMVDEIGGMTAYEIIKDELINVISGLNPAIVFNIWVYETGRRTEIFDSMVSATPQNIEWVKKALDPLNRFEIGGKNNAGIKTLGIQGKKIDAYSNPPKPIQFAKRDWMTPAFRAMEQQADAIFILTSRWGYIWHEKDEKRAWTEQDEQEHQESLKLAKKAHEEDNKQRKLAGLPPRFFKTKNEMIRVYVPNGKIKHPPIVHRYTPKDLIQSFATVFKQQEQNHSFDLLKKKRTFSINFIHIQPKGKNQKDENMDSLASLTHGQYKQLVGLDAIRTHSYRGRQL